MERRGIDEEGKGRREKGEGREEAVNLQVCLQVLVLLLIEQTDMKRRRGKEENRRAEAQGKKGSITSKRAYLGRDRLAIAVV